MTETHFQVTSIHLGAEANLTAVTARADDLARQLITTILGTAPLNDSGHGEILLHLQQIRALRAATKRMLAPAGRPSCTAEIHDGMRLAPWFDDRGQAPVPTAAGPHEHAMAVTPVPVDELG